MEQLQRFNRCAHNHRHPPLYFSNDRLHFCKGIWAPHCDLHDALSIFHLPNGEHHVECIHLPDCCTGHRKVSLFVYQWIWVCTMSILSDAPEQPKGQLISKRNSQAEDSPKNEQMNSFLLVCDVFSFVFWANPRPEKNCFEIIWPLKKPYFFSSCQFTTVLQNNQNFNFYQ